MICLQSVSKSYGPVRVVDQLSLTVKAGQTLCLIGSSGSGKSTTLRMLNRLIEPDAGSIQIQGEDIFAKNPVDLRRGIGYVIQQIGLFPHLNVARNIAMLLELEGWTRLKIRQRVDELLALVQLDPSLAQRFPHQLSGGQQQRVGVARALALNPPVILLDEPFAALDPLTRSQLQDSFLALQKRLGITALMVTHDLAEAFKCGDEIAILERGRLLQLGTPAEILHKPASQFVSDFIHAQTGAEHLLELPVGKLMVPLAEAGLGWVHTDGYVTAWRSLSGELMRPIPELAPEMPLREALRLLLGTALPGLPVQSQGPAQGILLVEEIRKLL